VSDTYLKFIATILVLLAVQDCQYDDDFTSRSTIFILIYVVQTLWLGATGELNVAQNDGGLKHVGMGIEHHKC
jgi:hypothetical protein